MAETVIPPKLETFESNNPEAVELLRRAQESDAADRQLTVLQALKKYKKAVFWAVLLSTSIVMEGYDLVMVSTAFASDFIELAAVMLISPFLDHFVFWPDAIQRAIRGS